MKFLSNMYAAVANTFVKFKNLPIKVKLLSSFAVIALPPLMTNFLIIVSLYDLSNSFNKIVTESYPQMEALFELKNAVSQIQILTASFILQKGESTQVEGSRAANLKYELLSRFSELDKWLIVYSKSESDKNHLSAVLSKLNINKNKVMLSALKVIELSESNLPNNKIEQQRLSLNITETSLVEQISEIMLKKTRDLQIKSQQIQDNINMNSFIASVFLFMLVFFVIGLSILLVKIISSPVIRLRNFARSIKSLDTNQQITINTHDEIGQLGDSLNQMIQRLHQLNKALLDTAHKAGMAEVASSVLHNIGNVLNSMNVSAQIINNKIQQIKIQELAEVISLLQNHLDELGSFFTDHPQGKLVITYLSKMTDYWQNEVSAITSESTLFNKNIDHIKSVISAQQSMSKAVGIIETVLVSELFNNALSIHRDLLSSHAINIENNQDATLHILIDRIKIEQILINLVRNAIDALINGKNDNKKLVLCTHMDAAENKIIIEVVDNGEGILKENLSKIFNFGFTTKKTGHGFGLHFCAIAANQMGGTLSAASEGHGKGSTFTLKVPVSPNSKADK